ncbi:hypothetical protein COT27_01210 [Candidatus Kuenenbacteria bacterium CG08_land_8_20_14_0_20_37_23]|uniref:Methicillin resistance protein n=1 Tax=Candidatus Kuenenbacteria bacterium CG08_land_8_20_14_0_20_37_23 TaxID=1974617 RepID=A0A2M6XT42_9BACT|nr:MAG: hypothetical protein COT27_01210 [Candidatus Kuenenbacteria bacterium CG08_land_8_20_14_0_20_37_23]
MKISSDYQNQKEWNEFLFKNSYPTNFLQSWDWGEFNQKILGNQIKRIVLFDDNELKMACLFIARQLPFNKSFWYCPRGFVLHKNYTDKMTHGYQAIMKVIRKDFRDKIFLRVVPQDESQEQLFDFLKKLDFKKPTILLASCEPNQTILLDLNRSEEELLLKMHPKTRYNINLATKKGIKIRVMTKQTQKNDFDVLYQLSQETAKRNNINIYSKKYYMDLINYFAQNETAMRIKLYIAEYQNKPLSAVIMVYFGSTATYLHGASSSEYRQLMPNHLIQWQAITDAKKMGMTIYDFWGISDTNPKWSGITQFKKSFGGSSFTFLGAWDYILDKKWYTIFRILKIFKKIIKN